MRAACLTRVFACILLAAAASLAGCGGHAAPVVPGATVYKGGPALWATVAPDANQNSPVAVDLVLVTNSKLLKLLQQVTVMSWFQQRAQWEFDNPRAMQVVSWQWVPGQKVGPIPLPHPGGVKGALIFADYDNAKAKPVLVNPDHGLVLNLMTAGIAVQPANH